MPNFVHIFHFQSSEEQLCFCGVSAGDKKAKANDKFLTWNSSLPFRNSALIFRKSSNSTCGSQQSDIQAVWSVTKFSKAKLKCSWVKECSCFSRPISWWTMPIFWSVSGKKQKHMHITIEYVGYKRISFHRSESKHSQSLQLLNIYWTHSRKFHLTRRKECFIFKNRLYKNNSVCLAICIGVLMIWFCICAK